jgi:hypothetical protein
MYILNDLVSQLRKSFNRFLFELSELLSHLFDCLSESNQKDAPRLFERFELLWVILPFVLILLFQSLNVGFQWLCCVPFVTLLAAHRANQWTFIATFIQTYEIQFLTFVGFAKRAFLISDSVLRCRFRWNHINNNRIKIYI